MIGQARRVSDLEAAGVLRVEDGNHGEYRPRPDEFVDEGVPFIRAADMTTGVVDFAGAGKINKVARLRIRKGVGAPGDVLLSHKGTVGKIAVAPLDAPDFVCSPQTTFWRSLNADLLDQRFLRYSMSSESFMRQLDVFKSSTDMAPYVSLTDQRSLVLVLPTAAEQRAIAEVLGALDDKIAANAKVLALLDDLVRVRYQQSKENATSSRLLGSLADNVRVKAAAGTVAPDSVYVGLEHVPRRSMWMTDHGRADAVSSDKWQFQPGDVLFGKLRPYFHKVIGSATTGICSTDILVLRARDPLLAGLILAAASDDETVATATSATEGTRMPRTNWKDLSTVPIPWTNDSEARSFSDGVGTMACLAHAAVIETGRLAATRDELLPLLMSGKVRVRDAEKVVEGVV